MGVSGILRPNGVFIPCSYGNHGLAAGMIPEKETEFCIYLSSGIEAGLDESSSLIYFNEKITRQQLQWLFIHYFKLDKTQRKALYKYIIHNKY